MVGDGTALSITHIGSTTIPSPSQRFKLTNVLAMKTNLISISKFCLSNNVFVEFLAFSSVVKDLCLGACLLQGPIKDGVYEWSTQVSSSPPLISFSSFKASIFE